MNCNQCPRKCGADRSKTAGFCGTGEKLRVARAGLHFWEEPCISGENGSGTVFFSGCNLRCVFCQNGDISAGCFGMDITEERLAEIFAELAAKGAENINLVTPSHYTDVLARVLEKHRPSVPVVWNSSGYESVGSLKKLEGLVDVYLPDMKYSSADTAARYSGAADYPETAKSAIREMYRQTGKAVFDGRGMMKKGMIIRHLVLPGNIENTLDVIDFISEFPQDDILFSIMAQYTPRGDLGRFPELQRKLTEEEYGRVTDYLVLCGMENGFLQELSAATEDFIPNFDLSGVDKS